MRNQDESDASDETRRIVMEKPWEQGIAHEEKPLSVNGRLDLPADKIGFDQSPPCKVGLRIFPSESRWNAYILTPAEKRTLVEKWLQAYNPCSSHTASGIAPRIMCAEFITLPDKLVYLLNAIHVQNINLYPQGVASVLVCDQQTTVKAFVQTVLQPGEGSKDVWVRESMGLDRPHRVRITVRQNEALSLAVALGYYEVPHRIGLRELALKMDMSLGALSGLLRRAESTVLHSFADHFMKAEWRDLDRQLEGMRQSNSDAQAESVKAS